MMLTPKLLMILLGIGFTCGWIVGRGFMRQALQKASRMQSGKR